MELGAGVAMAQTLLNTIKTPSAVPAGVAVLAAGTRPCPQCGKTIAAEAKFCPECGKPQA